MPQALAYTHFHIWCSEWHDISDRGEARRKPIAPGRSQRLFSCTVCRIVDIRNSDNTKESNVSYRLQVFPVRDAGMLYRKMQHKKRKSKSHLSLVGKMRNTRFSEFLTGVLSKGVWWMPRLKKAMKDAA